MHLLARSKKWRREKMNSAAWAQFSFLVTRGHRSCTRMAAACGYWLLTENPVTSLLPWKHRFKALFLNSPKAVLDPLWVPMWSSTHVYHANRQRTWLTAWNRGLPGEGDQVVAQECSAIPERSHRQTEYWEAPGAMPWWPAVIDHQGRWKRWQLEGKVQRNLTEKEMLKSTIYSSSVWAGKCTSPASYWKSWKAPASDTSIHGLFWIQFIIPNRVEFAAVSYIINHPPQPRCNGLVEFFMHLFVAKYFQLQHREKVKDQRETSIKIQISQ